jgi:hypothetical protein
MAEDFSDDDGVFDDPVFSVAFAKATRGAFPRPSQTCASGTTSNRSNNDDEFGDEWLTDSDLFAAFKEAMSAETSLPVIVIDDDDLETLLERLDWAPQGNVPKTQGLEAHLPSSISKYSEFGEDELGTPDFEDPALVSAILKAEQAAMQCHHLGSPTKRRRIEQNEDMITISRSDLQAAVQNAAWQAYAAGRRSYHVDWRKHNVFDFLKLPPELRMMIYKYSLEEKGQPATNTQTAAIPYRLGNTLDWKWAHFRPQIRTALLRTCKQIYYETRDSILYKNRYFEAQINRFDAVFRDFAPHMIHWQYLQHLQLTIDDLSRFRLGIRRYLDHIVALLRGGRHLMSFNLVYKITKNPEHIMGFQDLQVKGSVSITQVFDDGARGLPGERVQDERRTRLRSLLGKMRGLRG